MKIGILTYHSVYNFGANLQVYSTIGYLKNNGFIPIVINWIPEDLESRYNRSISPVQADAHKKFIKNYLPCTEICRSDSDIVKVIEKENIKGIIIGSDALFHLKPFLSRVHLRKKGIIIDPNPTSDYQFPNPFWGSFILSMKNRIPVIAMSVSSHNTIYKYIRGGLKTNIGHSLRLFKSISVRDEWTRQMIIYLTNGSIQPSITPDPVFGYNQNIKDQFTKSEITEKFGLPEKFLLFSLRSNNIVSKEWLKSLIIAAGKNDLECIGLTMPGGIVYEYPFSKIIESPLCPREWYGLIKYSSGYIGENMHPIIVALHNAVPFYSFDSYGIVKYKYFVNEKSSKIYDILLLSGFLKNRVNILGRSFKCPSPEEVISQIINFNYKKCNDFSINQQDDYNSMMKSIISFLIPN